MTEATMTAKSGTNENTGQEEVKKEAPFSLTMDKRIDLVIAVFIIFYGAFMVYHASRFMQGRVEDIFTAKGMPYACGIFLIICGIILTILRISSWSEMPGNLVVSEATKEDDEGHPANWKRSFAIIGLAWIDVWLYSSLGYLITTPLFLFGCVWLMGVRSWKKVVLFPLIFTAATWYVFSQIMGFLIPLGVLEDPFRALGFLA
jgi:putative tricarboxylic transport membrane protein